jgi:hypothetical protein
MDVNRWACQGATTGCPGLIVRAMLVMTPSAEGVSLVNARAETPRVAPSARWAPSSRRLEHTYEHRPGMAAGQWQILGDQENSEEAE